jgi:Na+/melibiose symporter-like transporter
VPYGRLTGVLVVLFLVSVLYAILLQVLERRWGAVSDYTWLAVVAGVSYTLAGLAVLDLRAAALALIVFAVSAVPIVARSIVNDVRDRNELRHYLARPPVLPGGRRGNGGSPETLA